MTAARKKGVGRLVVDFDARNLLEGQRRIALTERAFSLLEVLLAHPGKLLTKRDLMQRVWGDACVEESNLTVTVSTLRKALREGDDGPHIETVARKGYRWVAPLLEIPASAGAWPAAGAYGVDRPAASSMRAAQPPPEIVVGRQRELAELAAALDRATAGRGQLVLISGEAGMGKTTLLHAFLEGVAATPAAPLVACGHCLQVLGPSEAYFPVLGALTELLSSSERELIESAITEHAPSWRRHFARLARRSPAAATTAEAGAESWLRQLGDLLAAVAAIRPLVLCLEDIHWADPSTRDLLQLLATRVAQCRLLVIATFRPEAPGASSWGFGSGNAFEGTSWSAWATERNLLLLDLEALSVADLVAYVERRFTRHDIKPELAALAHRRTEGLALFATRWLATLIESGAANDLGHEALAALERWMPDRLLDLIGHALGCLAPVARRLLSHASVEGDEFRVALLAQLARVSPLLLEEELAELSRRRLIQRIGDEELPDGQLTARYRFTHVLYQNVLYDGLGTQSRVDLHRRTAEALSARGAAESPRFRPPLALHLELGGDYSGAVRVLIAAGEYADRTGVAREAMAYFARARQLLPRLPREERLASGLILHHAEAWASACLGRLVESFDHLAAMKAHAGEIADCAVDASGARASDLVFEHFERPWQDGAAWRSSPLMPNQPRSFGMTALEAEVLACKCCLLALVHDLDRLAVAARELAELGRSTQNNPRRSEALVWLGVERLQRGDLVHARDLLEQGIGLAREVRHERSLRMLSALATLQACRGELSEAERSYEECLEVVVSAGNVDECFVGLGEVRARRGNITAALGAYTRAAELSQARGARPPLLRSGWLHHELGDIDEAIAIGTRALESLRTCFLPRHVPTLYSQLARSHIRQGDLALAREALAQADARLEPHESACIWHVDAFWSAQCELAMACGESLRAQDLASRWLELASAQEAPESIARAQCVLARLAVERGEATLGRACADAAVAALGTTDSPLTGFTVHALRAEVAWRCQDADSARQAQHAARACAERITAGIADARLLGQFRREVELRLGTGRAQRP
jgi:DNA-binding winged helix-turn-helix (wHTH) protein/tetratricopeptide (TPR) repeat protein